MAMWCTTAILCHSRRWLSATEYVLASLTHRGACLNGVGPRLQAADVYVSPYHAEGFNLPVLEAVACGIPVVVSAGGSTEDFTHPAFARYRITFRRDKCCTDCPYSVVPCCSGLSTPRWRRL